MNEEKPGLDEFRNQVEFFHGGQGLTPAAAVGAEDFWENWEAIFNRISNDYIRANVDVLRLGKLVAQYKRYHTWKSLGILFFLLAFILVFFVWEISAVSLLIGVGIYFYGNYVRHADGKNFSVDLMDEAKRNPVDKGMANLCANYLAGTIELASETGSAHWPQYPSDVLTGDTNFIQMS